MTQDTCDEATQMGEMQKENNGLKEELIALTKKISYFELEVTMLKREKFEVQKEKTLRQRLEN